MTDAKKVAEAKVCFRVLATELSKNGKAFERTADVYPPFTVASSMLWGDAIHRYLAQRPIHASYCLSLDFHKDQGAWKLADHLKDAVGPNNVELYQFASGNGKLATAYKQFVTTPGMLTPLSAHDSDDDTSDH
jgi:hypothetical protein